MRLFRLIRAQFHALIYRDVIADEIRDELRFHVDACAEEYERGGLPPDEARRKAQRRVGNLALHQDRGYDLRGGGLIETVWQDFRYSVRLLRRQKGFAIGAILTLGLGIGASTAIFSVIDAAILRPLPYSEPEQLVELWVETVQPDGRTSRLDPSYADMLQWRNAAAVSSVARSRSLFFGRVVDGAQPERVSVGEMSTGYLDVYRVAPLTGRAFNDDDANPAAPQVVLLGYAYWQGHFGGANVIGQSITFDDGPATIVGVLPARFQADTAMWRPMRLPTADQRGSGSMTIARVQPETTIELAEQQLSAMTSSGIDGARQPLRSAVRARSMLDRTRSSYRTTVSVLAGAVGLILLIACVNVAGLLLARGTTRQAELAVRASIGAGRGRLVRQLLTENLVLSVTGGLVGISTAWLALDWLVSNIPLALSSDAPAQLNVRVLSAALTLTVLTSLIFGLVPALRLSRISITTVLARTSRRQGSALTRRGGQVLIAAEIALAVVLVAGAGLMIRSFGRITNVDLGFDPASIVTMQVTPLSPDPAVHAQYYPALLETLRKIPGIAEAGAIDNIPLGGSSTTTFFGVEGKMVGVTTNQFLPGYFESIGQALLQGELPTEADVAQGRNVLVISQATARAWFPDGRAIGRTVQRKLIRENQSYDVVAVVADLRERGPLYDSRPTVYTPFRPSAGSFRQSRGLIVVLRTSARASVLGNRLREAASSIGPRVLVERMGSGEELFAKETAGPRQRTVLLTLLGALGFILALVGVFGMTAYAVAHRTQEIGVRMAFGARAGQVVARIVRDSALPILVGILIGLAAATLATRMISSFLFNTTPTDPATFVVVAITLAIVGCLAAWLPAQRAARVDPVTALRVE